MPNHKTNRISLVGIILSLLSANLSANVSANVTASASNQWLQACVGRAYALDKEEFLYEERHQLLYQGDNPKTLSLTHSRVDYVNAKGQLFAVKTVDYSQHQHTPSFKLTYLDRNYQQGGQAQAEHILLFDSEDNKRKEKSFPIQSNMIADAGFDNFVRSHWQQLNEGEQVKVKFLSPARLDLFKFELTPKNQPNNTENRLRLTFKLSNAWVAWLLDPIHLEYDKATQQLLSYQGITNIEDPKGNSYAAKIIYSYQPIRPTNLQTAERVYQFDANRLNE